MLGRGKKKTKVAVEESWGLARAAILVDVINLLQTSSHCAGTKIKLNALHFWLHFALIPRCPPHGWNECESERNQGSTPEESSL